MDALEQRFNEIYEQYKDLVWWHVSHKFVGNNADKEDIVQQIWMGVWQHIDRIPDEKVHAFLYKTITNQINKAIYYSMRDKKVSTIEKEETSEGEHFDLLEITKLIDQMDDYSYFELMDTVENILTEDEFQIFLAFIAGISKMDIEKAFKINKHKRAKIFNTIDRKLAKEFGSNKTIFYVDDKIRLNRSEAQKKAWAEGKYDRNRHRGPMSKKQREAISKANKGKAKTKGYHWYNNGIEEKNLKECPKGWKPGRLKK